MRIHSRLLVCLVAALAVSEVRAQIPAIPSTPTIPTAPTIPTTPTTPTPTTPATTTTTTTTPGATATTTTTPTSGTPPCKACCNIYSFILPTPDQSAACQARFCASPFGQVISALLRPVSLYSGGVVGSNFCSGQNNNNNNSGLNGTNQTNFVNPANLSQPDDSALGAAARIQQDDAQAMQRRQAVEYLGTVDGDRYPEAQAALINSLRGDRNECVRLAAAKALQRGCSCGKPVMEALLITISGGSQDGFPPECSHRVKAAADVALHKCLHRCTVVPVEPEKPPEAPGRPELPGPVDRKPPPAPPATPIPARPRPTASEEPPTAAPEPPIVPAAHTSQPQDVSPVLPPPAGNGVPGMETWPAPDADNSPPPAPNPGATAPPPSAPAAAPAAAPPRPRRDLLAIIKRAFGSGNTSQ